MINNYGSKMKRNSNSKLAQFKAAVAHLPFTSFDESNDDIIATYSNSSIDIEVIYNPMLKGTSCNFTIYRNDVQTDSYGTYDIDEFVEQLEPYFNLGNEVSLLKQLDRRLTKLEMLANDDSSLARLLQQELTNSDSDSEVNYASSVPLGELLDLINEGYVKDIIITAIQTGELDKATLEDMLVMAYDREEKEIKNRDRKNNSLVSGAAIGTNSDYKVKLGYGISGMVSGRELLSMTPEDKATMKRNIQQIKTNLGNVELDETVGYVKRKDGKLVKRKLVL